MALPRPTGGSGAGAASRAFFAAVHPLRNVVAKIARLAQQEHGNGALPMRIGLLLIALLALAGCATPAPRPAEPVYYVTRHLNTPEGERDPDLTAEGRANADRLAARLAADPPRAIYVSDFKRTRQTAAPLGGRLGLEPKVYDPADTPALVARVKAERTGPVLIVGHSNTVPDIVEALGGTRPGALHHPDFGDLWIIRGGRSIREKYGH